jgi:ABC-type antimicrobial peptide transport system permease subunit
MGTAVLRGREFSESDTAATEPVVIINESAARLYYPGEDAVGKEMWLEQPKPYRVVGIVQDAKYASLREEAPRTVYFNFMQEKFVSYVNLAIRASVDKGLVVNAFRSILRSAGKDVRITDAGTMSEQIDQALVRERLVAMLAAFFGILAIALVSIGLYGFMSFAVVRRTGEIGIRLALGALPRRVLGMVMREAVLLAIAGLAIGLPAALFASRIVASMLYGVKGADPALLGICAALTIAVACAAVAIPARRASRVDPMTALRNE